MSNKNEPLIAKIAALLAKAESSEFGPEREAFFAKADELMKTHQLDLDDIDDDPLNVNKGGHNIYASMAYAKLLIGAVARYYGCICVTQKVGNHYRYELVGRESARITADLMFPFIHDQVKHEAKGLAAELGISASKARRQVGQALCIRLNELSRGSNPISNDVTQWLADNMKTSPGRARTLKFGQGARNRAGGISLAHQTTGGSAAKQLT